MVAEALARVVLEEPDSFLAEQARRRFRHFVRQAWPVVEPATELIPGFYLDAIADHLQAVAQGQIRNLLITIPPGFAKSTLVSVLYPAWRWIDHPEHRFLTTSHDGDLAIRDAVRSRRIINADWYQAHWGDRFQMTGDQNVKSRYENDKTGYRVAAGVNAGLTGERADTVVCDDPHNVKHADSEPIREGTVRWWNEAMSTRLNDPKTGAKIVIQQRVHESDLAGNLIAQGYDHLSLPMEYEPTEHVTGIGWRDPRTDPGELLHPERYGPEQVAEQKRVLGSYAYAAQYQQRPSPAEGGILKRQWWRFWHYPGQPLPPVQIRMPDGSLHEAPCVSLPPFWDGQLQSWDMSFKDTKSGGYVCGQVWGAWRADRFLLDQMLAQLDFPATVAAVRDLTDRWPQARRKLVEDKANGPAVIATLKHEIAGLVAVEPEGGKVTRANAVTPEIESGNVYLPHPRIASWVDAFIDECASFPRGKHDDQVDSMTQALLRLGAGGGNVTVTTNYMAPDEDDEEGGPWR